jgi:hypothetical protein
MGDCLLWAVFGNTNAAHIYGLLFPQLSLCINIGKNRLGYILGNVFTNSSGHLAIRID